MARDLELERAWRERVRRQGKSGLTIQAFCEQEGLAAHQFSWWRRELKRRDSQTGAVKKRRKQAKRKQTASAKFVPVEVAPANRSSPSIEIVLDNPPRISVPAGFDEELLRQVLRVLEDGPC